MRYKILFALIVLTASICISSNLSAQKSASIWITNADSTKRLSGQAPLKSVTGQAGELILIDSAKTFQEMDGVGAALTWSSAFVLKNHLTPERRYELLQELFTKTGIGINYLRLTIGSSDFSRGNHSYSEYPDSSLANFTLEMDKDEVIPILKEIIAINPCIKIMASPWSPPAWMKTSESMVGGSLKADCYRVYAEYLIKYVQSMGELGIKIDAITIQNEPEYGTAAYPCMLMSAEEQKTFVKKYLGPAMKKSGEKFKIILFDHNCDSPQYPISIMDDPEARQYVDGAGFHLYKGEVGTLCSVHAAHPDKNIYFTEQSGGGWAPGFSGNIDWFTGTLIIGATRCWSKNVLLWNLALDEKDGPTNNGCLNCWGVVQVSSSGTIKRNPEYYALGHFGKFVQPGARRVWSTSGVVANSVFKNPDGNMVFIANNSSDTGQVFTIVCGNDNFTYNIAPHEVATIVWR